MTELTLKELAAGVQTSMDHLTKQFTKEELPEHTNNSAITKEKEVSLAHPNCEFKSSLDKLTLKRKTRSTLNVSRSDGKNKSIQIEIRKKQVVIKSPLKEERSSLKEKSNSHYMEAFKKEIKSKKEHENTRKKERESVRKDRVKNLKENEIIEKNKTIRFFHEKKFSKVEIKMEEIPFRVNKKNENTWNNAVDSVRNYKYRTTAASPYTYQSDDDHEHEKIENSYSHRLKERRKRKESKHFGFKTRREEDFVIIRENKSEKCKNSPLQQVFKKPTQSMSREVVIGEAISVGELAAKMAVKSSQVIKTMMNLGSLVTINHILDQETAQLITEEMGHKVILRCDDELEKTILSDRDTSIITKPRAPVVTIMGHVDHGKTSLLDCIRSTKVALNEAGGITQHIGAYRIETVNGIITFLDTPGHAAFTAMRARGAKITDIIVLVVAADDGVMPQTIEAIQHAKAEKTSIIVAINKIDKPESDLDKIRNELAQYGIISDEWGGECQFINVSAKTGSGINELLNAILLQAEILELKAIHEGMASGSVIESCLDKGRGPIATVLVREGTLRKGDIILCGFEYGRVRAMRDEFGQEVIKAGPSVPVEIFGLSGVPTAGDKVTVVRDERKAREVALYRQSKFREVKLARQQKSKLENVFSNMSESVTHEINIVLKADVQGSVEAVSDALLKLSTEEVKIKIVGSGVGGITETDAILASTSNAILIGFNVRVNSSARCIIESGNLDLRCYSVIYDLINEMKVTMSALLSPEKKQQVMGFAEVRSVFKSPKFGVIAGCMVTEGVVKCSSSVRIFRNGVVIHEGELESLRRFKEDVHEVRSGTECGIVIKKYNDICSGDTIEVFEIVKTKRKID